MILRKPADVGVAAIDWELYVLVESLTQKPHAQIDKMMSWDVEKISRLIADAIKESV